MKLKLISIILFLVIMAALPISIVKCNFTNSDSGNSKIKNNVSEPSDSKQINDKKTLLCGLVAAQYDESYCDETIRAIAILMQSDYDAEPQKFNLENKDIYLSKDEAENSIKEKALDNDNVSKHIEGKDIVKIIVIKGKIVNIVVK